MLIAFSKDITAWKRWIFNSDIPEIIVEVGQRQVEKGSFGIDIMELQEPVKELNSVKLHFIRLPCRDLNSRYYYLLLATST